MWYSDSNENQLDFSKAIFAGNDLVLLPRIGENTDYSIVGYNWFNMVSGEFNSCYAWKNARHAVDTYSFNYTISNGKLTKS